MAVARCATWVVSPPTGSNRLADVSSKRSPSATPPAAAAAAAHLSGSHSASYTGLRGAPGFLPSKASSGFFAGDWSGLSLLFPPTHLNNSSLVAAQDCNRDHASRCNNNNNNKKKKSNNKGWHVIISPPPGSGRERGWGGACHHVCACAAPAAIPSVTTSPANSAIEALEPLRATEPALTQSVAKAFAPATIANLGPGFDFLGCAVQGLGDHVIAEVSDDVPPGEVEIVSIAGDGGRLSLSAENNCAGIAAKATLRLLGVRSVGVALKLEKGLPLGSGLGSSAASAAAAACAVNGLFGSALSGSQLVTAGLISEATVSGFHADNIAPSILGGFVLVRSLEPLELLPLEWGGVPKRGKGNQDQQEDGTGTGTGVDSKPSSLYFVVVTPSFEAPTKEMRAVLPEDISMKTHINNSTQGAALVAAILKGDPKLLGAAMASDAVVEPRRIALIPGMAAVKVSAMMAGSYGCTISGAGPTAVAVTDSREKGEIIGAAMKHAFLAVGKLPSKVSVEELDVLGARLVDL